MAPLAPSRGVTSQAASGASRRHLRGRALPFAFAFALLGCSQNDDASAMTPSFSAAGQSPSAGSSSGGAGAGQATGASGRSANAAAGSSGTGGTDAGGGGIGGGVAVGGYSSSADDPGTEGDGIFQVPQPFKAAPEFQRAAGVPQGDIVRFTIPTSVLYPNAHDRKIAAYVPQQYEVGKPAPVMVIQDGTDFYGFDGAFPPVFDNLIAQGKLPPLVVVFTGNGGGDSVGSERGLEYDTVSGLYAQWADQELLPAVEAATKLQKPERAVTFTKDPEGRGCLGGSSGGAASFSMAWWRPDLFRRVLTFSGTYVSQVPKTSPFPNGAWIYHDQDPYVEATPNGLIAAFCESESGMKTSSAVEPCDTPLNESACLAVAGCTWNTKLNKPVRVWLEAGTNDNGASSPASSHRNFKLANERMAQALLARGYHVHFDECVGAGHVDQGPIRQTLPAALTWLWRGFKSPP
jgi:S-formylglutathione hydrolase FrmB